MSNTIYTVYKTTNLINNKIYIGVHATSNINDSYLGSGIAIKSAIQKYGKNNFKKEVLFECDTKDDAYLKESTIVNEDYINREDTYNLCLGGVGGYKQSKFTQFKKSKVQQHKKIKYKKIPKQYITPWGNFKSIKLAIIDDVKYSHLMKWCKYSNNIIQMKDLIYSIYLSFLPISPIGKTFKDLGFDYIPKSTQVIDY